MDAPVDAQQRFDEQDSNLRLTKQLLDIAMWKMELTTGRLVLCDHAQHVYGVTPDALADDFDGYVTMVHPDDRADIVACLDNFKASSVTRFEFAHRIQRADGSTHHVRGIAEREDRDGEAWLTGVVQDVTGAVQAREQLAEASNLQRIAGATARLGGWSIDLNPFRTTWSPEVCALHDEPVGTAPSLEDANAYFLPEHRDRLRTATTACTEAGVVFDEVAQLLTAKGRRLWVRLIGEPIRDEKGAIVGLHGAMQDISELVAARGQSEGLARRLLQMLESMSDAFYLLDREWRFAFLNSQAEMLLRQSRQDLVGRSVWEAFPDAVDGAIDRQYQTAVDTGHSVRFQEYFAPLETWFEIDAYPTPEGLAVYFRDVTQTRARDEHLRLLEAAVAHQNDILLITEAWPVHAPDGPRIVYVNDAFVKLTGFTREEAIGQTPHMLQGPNTQPEELHRIRDALDNWRPVRAELINYTKAGKEFWLELDIVPLADEAGCFSHWVAIERDITQRKAFETALHRSEERFRLVVNATNDVISDWDLLADTVWWNENFQARFGYDPSRVEAVSTWWSWWLGRVHPDDRSRVSASIDCAIAGSTSTWTEEYRLLHAEGHALTVVDRAFIIRDPGGRAIRMLGSMVDVTCERETEARLRHALKLETVGQLTGGVAHDFNNLLTVILGNAEMLGEMLDDQPRLRTLADMITTAADRAANLTARLLAFSRKQALAPRLVDVGSLIRGMEGLLRRTLGENVEIAIECPEKPWHTEVDPSQLEAAILNLALNARDAMSGGGLLTIAIENAKIDDEEAARAANVDLGQYVVINVTDTGEGMSPDILARIFEPFFTTKEVGKGTGLGLSMVYGFVKQSGGQVRAASAPAEGTSFWLYFPRAQSGEATTPHPPAERDVVGGHERILVVEDNALVRENLVLQLSGLGYDVISAAAGPAGVTILKQDAGIALMLTDVVMPGGMNGGELAEIARSLRPKMKILFTSGFAETAFVHGGQLDPGLDLLSKPYRLQQLATAVRKVLDAV